MKSITGAKKPLLKGLSASDRIFLSEGTVVLVSGCLATALLQVFFGLDHCAGVRFLQAAKTEHQGDRISSLLFVETRALLIKSHSGAVMSSNSKCSALSPGGALYASRRLPGDNCPAASGVRNLPYKESDRLHRGAQDRRNRCTGVMVERCYSKPELEDKTRNWTLLGCSQWKGHLRGCQYKEYPAHKNVSAKYQEPAEWTCGRGDCPKHPSTYKRKEVAVVDLVGITNAEHGTVDMVEHGTVSLLTTNTSETDFDCIFVDGDEERLADQAQLIKTPSHAKILRSAFTPAEAGFQISGKFDLESASQNVSRDVLKKEKSAKTSGAPLGSANAAQSYPDGRAYSRSYNTITQDTHSIKCRVADSNVWDRCRCKKNWSRKVMKWRPGRISNKNSALVKSAVLIPGGYSVHKCKGLSQFNVTGRSRCGGKLVVYPGDKLTRYLSLDGVRFEGKNGPLFYLVGHDVGCEPDGNLIAGCLNENAVRASAEKGLKGSEIMDLQLVNAASNDTQGGFLYAGKSARFCSQLARQQKITKLETILGPWMSKSNFDIIDKHPDVSWVSDPSQSCYKLLNIPSNAELVGQLSAFYKEHNSAKVKDAVRMVEEFDLGDIAASLQSSYFKLPVGWEIYYTPTDQELRHRPGSPNSNLACLQLLLDGQSSTPKSTALEDFYRQFNPTKVSCTREVSLEFARELFHTFGDVPKGWEPLVEAEMCAANGCALSTSKEDSGMSASCDCFQFRMCEECVCFGLGLSSDRGSPALEVDVLDGEGCSDCPDLSLSGVLAEVEGLNFQSSLGDIEAVTVDALISRVLPPKSDGTECLKDLRASSFCSASDLSSDSNGSPTPSTSVVEDLIRNQLRGTIVETIGDGQCLFRSVGKSVGLQPGAVMRLCRDHLRSTSRSFQFDTASNKRLCENLADKYLRFDKVMHNVSFSTNEWGSSDDISIIVRTFNRDVVILRMKSEHPKSHDPDGVVIHHHGNGVSLSGFTNKVPFWNPDRMRNKLHAYLKTSAGKVAIFLIHTDLYHFNAVLTSSGSISDACTSNSELDSISQEKIVPSDGGYVSGSDAETEIVLQTPGTETDPVVIGCEEEESDSGLMDLAAEFSLTTGHTSAISAAALTSKTSAVVSAGISEIVPDSATSATIPVHSATVQTSGSSVTASASANSATVLTSGSSVTAPASVHSATVLTAGSSVTAPASAKTATVFTSRTTSVVTKSVPAEVGSMSPAFESIALSPTWQKKLNNSGVYRCVGVDATFCCVTELQIVTIWGREREDQPRSQLLFSASMNRRCRGDYRVVFLHLKRLCPKFSPEVFSSDFESGMWKSFSEVFGCTFVGCLFHFKRAIKKQMIEKGVPAESRIGLMVLISKMHASLTHADFVLNKAVFISAVGLGINLPTMAGTEPFGVYFQQHWLAGTQAFPEEWGSYNLPVVEGMVHCTNNIAEVQHRFMKGFVRDMSIRKLGIGHYMLGLSGFCFQMLARNTYAEATDHAGRPRFPGLSTSRKNTCRSSSSLSDSVATGLKRARGISEPSSPPDHPPRPEPPPAAVILGSHYPSLALIKDAVDVFASKCGNQPSLSSTVAAVKDDGSCALVSVLGAEFASGESSLRAFIARSAAQEHPRWDQDHLVGPCISDIQEALQSHSAVRSEYAADSSAWCSANGFLATGGFQWTSSDGAAVDVFCKFLLLPAQNGGLWGTAAFFRILAHTSGSAIVVLEAAAGGGAVVVEAASTYDRSTSRAQERRTGSFAGLSIAPDAAVVLLIGTHFWTVRPSSLISFLHVPPPPLAPLALSGAAFGGTAALGLSDGAGAASAHSSLDSGSISRPVKRQLMSSPSGPSRSLTRAIDPGTSTTEEGLLLFYALAESLVEANFEVESVAVGPPLGWSAGSGLLEVRVCLVGGKCSFFQLPSAFSICRRWVRGASGTVVETGDYLFSFESQEASRLSLSPDLRGLKLGDLQGGSSDAHCIFEFDSSSGRLHLVTKSAFHHGGMGSPPPIFRASKSLGGCLLVEIRTSVAAVDQAQEHSRGVVLPSGKGCAFVSSLFSVLDDLGICFWCSIPGLLVRANCAEVLACKFTNLVDVSAPRQRGSKRKRK